MEGNNLDKALKVLSFSVNYSTFEILKIMAK